MLYIEVAAGPGTPALRAPQGPTCSIVRQARKQAIKYPGTGLMVLQSQPTVAVPFAADAPPVAPTRASIGRANTKLMLVSFRNGEAVSRHPELVPYLQDGWEISSAVPRLIEHGGTRLFVVLRKSANVL